MTNYIYLNGEFINQTSDSKSSKLLLSFSKKKSVYEVVRVRDGHPQFLLPHIERLQKSWSLANFGPEIYSVKDLESICREIISLNQISNQNLRIDASPKDIFVRPAVSNYPPPEIYQKGVATAIMEYTRPNPKAKVNNMSLTHNAAQLRESLNVFELILVDNLGRITEGARSNIFFIDGKTVYTAPDSLVLGGITKQMVEKTSPYKIEQKIIMANEIMCFDACFLTGTSIDLLPIKNIDKIEYGSAENEVYKQMLKAFITTK